MKALTLAFVALFSTVTVSVAKQAPKEPEPQEEQPGAYLVIIAASHAGGNNTGVAISYLPFESLPKCEAATKAVHPGGDNSIYKAESFCVPQ